MGKKIGSLTFINALIKLLILFQAILYLGFLKIDINNLVSYGADNASVNYGRHHSVYTNIKQLCPKLISSNCNCHVIHNFARIWM